MALAHLGAARLAPNGVTLGGPGTFLDFLHQELDREFIVSVHLGPPRANRKPVIQLMDPEAKTVAYVKLGINEMTCSRVRSEAEALRLLSDAGASALQVPNLVTSGQWSGLDYLVMDPVPTDSGRQVTAQLRDRATSALVGAFPSNRVPLRESSWWIRTLSDLGRCIDSPDAERLARVGDRVEAEHGPDVVLQGAGHGDFSPWNVCALQDRLVTWDWEKFALDMPVGWDELHFRLNGYPGGAVSALSSPQRGLRGILDKQSDDSDRLLLVTYLINRGVNYLVDGQLQAGARHGPLSDWLLPSLERLVDGDLLA